MGVDSPQGAPSTLQVQSAIDQLTYLHRILHGDDNMSLTELLASTSASGPSSSLPSGGLSKALPSLVSILLPAGQSLSTSTFSFQSGNMSQAQKSHLAKMAAFQPRQYLAMTSELATRTSDKEGEMFRAIQLAQSLLKQSDLSSIKKNQKERILKDRKRRRIAIEQRQTLEEQQNTKASSSMHQQSGLSKFTSTTSYHFPSTLQGKTIDLEQEPNKEDIRHFIKVWKTELINVDIEASQRVKVKLQQWAKAEKGLKYLLRLKIDETGFAWLWVNFNHCQAFGWCARIHRINLLAESEVEEALETPSLSVALQSSKFPLYRRITSLLHTKLIHLKPERDNPWAHLVESLFALSSLCRLNQVHSLSGEARLQGQENILNALSHHRLDTVEDEDKDESPDDAKDGIQSKDVN